MDKKYIKDILNCTCMIHRISKNKTQCGHVMTDFYFFKIFFEALRSADIIANIHHEIKSFNRNDVGNINMYRYLIIKKGDDELKVLINEDILKLGISRYNASCAKEDTSFIESTLMLINIFTDLLG